MLAHELLKKEVLFKHDLEELIGPRPFEEKKEPEPEDKTDHSGNGQMKDSEDIPVDKEDDKEVPKNAEEEAKKDNKESDTDETKEDTDGPRKHPEQPEV